jgi:hypothetical protein
MSSGDQLSLCAVCGGMGHWESSHSDDAQQVKILQYWLTKPNYSPVQTKHDYVFVSGNIILGRGATAIGAIEDAMNNTVNNNKAS